MKTCPFQPLLWERQCAIEACRVLRWAKWSWVDIEAALGIPKTTLHRWLTKEAKAL